MIPISEPPKEPTTTHVCFDGKLKPGKGTFGRGADMCLDCRAKYQRDRRANAREAKYANLPERGGVVGVIRLNKGHDGTPTTKHGFYRKKLTPQEARQAQELHARFHEEYDLDPLVDDLMLMTMLSNLIKSFRKEPEFAGKDHNIRDAQSYYERQFREIADTLGISRRQRKTEDKADNVADAISKLFHKKPTPISAGAEENEEPPPTERD